MKSLTRKPLAVLALCVLFPAARAGVLTPGNLTVASSLSGEVRLLSPQGAAISTLPANHTFYFKDVLVTPYGQIVMIYERKVVLLDADGGLITEFDDNHSMFNNAGAIGPRGRIYLLSGGEVRVYNQGGSRLQRFTGQGSENWEDLAFGPDGNLYVAVVNPLVPESTELRVFDPDGRLLCSLNDADLLVAPEALGFGPNGHLYVAQQVPNGSTSAPILEFDLTDGSVRELGRQSGLTRVGGLAFGPDGRLLVTDYVQGVIYRFTQAGDLLDVLGAGTGLVGPARLHFTPYRFEARISGRVRLNQGPAEVLSETGVLAIFPDTRQVFLGLDLSGQESGGGLAAALEIDEQVFHGRVAFEGPTSKKRAFHGIEVPSNSIQDGISSLALEFKGRRDELTGQFEIRKAKGALQLFAEQGVFIGLVRSGSALD